MNTPAVLQPKAHHIAAAATQKQRQAASASHHVWVGAHAGTGKTHVLTQRILTLLVTDPTLQPRHILGLTYTKAAAQEMQHRLRHTARTWATMAEEDLLRTLAPLCAGRTPTAADAARTAA